MYVIVVGAGKVGYYLTKQLVAEGHEVLLLEKDRRRHAMLAESLFLFWIAWSPFGLATNNNALYTFSFLTLLYFAAFSIVSARERRWFGATIPSKTLVGAVIGDALTGTVLTFVGLPGLMPLPWWQTLAIFVYAMVSCLVVNDTVKVATIKWRVPTAAA